MAFGGKKKISGQRQMQNNDVLAGEQVEIPVGENRSTRKKRYLRGVKKVFGFSMPSLGKYKKSAKTRDAVVRERSELEQIAGDIDSNEVDEDVNECDSNEKSDLSSFSSGSDSTDISQISSSAAMNSISPIPHTSHECEEVGDIPMVTLRSVPLLTPKPRPNSKKLMKKAVKKKKFLASDPKSNVQSQRAYSRHKSQSSRPYHPQNFRNRYYPSYGEQVSPNQRQQQQYQQSSQQRTLQHFSPLPLAAQQRSDDSYCYYPEQYEDSKFGNHDDITEDMSVDYDEDDYDDMSDDDDTPNRLFCGAGNTSFEVSFKQNTIQKSPRKNKSSPKRTHTARAVTPVAVPVSPDQWQRKDPKGHRIYRRGHAAVVSPHGGDRHYSTRSPNAVTQSSYRKGDEEHGARQLQNQEDAESWDLDFERQVDVVFDALGYVATELIEVPDTIADEICKPIFGDSNDTKNEIAKKKREEKEALDRAMRDLAFLT